MTRAGAITILHSFYDGSVANDGDTALRSPDSGTRRNFYGTAHVGGSTSSGAYGQGMVVFRLTVGPESGPNLAIGVWTPRPGWLLPRDRSIPVGDGFQVSVTSGGIDYAGQYSGDCAGWKWAGAVLVRCRARRLLTAERRK